MEDSSGEVVDWFFMFEIEEVLKWVKKIELIGGDYVVWDKNGKLRIVGVCCDVWNDVKVCVGLIDIGYMIKDICV